MAKTTSPGTQVQHHAVASSTTPLPESPDAPSDVPGGTAHPRAPPLQPQQAPPPSHRGTSSCPPSACGCASAGGRAVSLARLNSRPGYRSRPPAKLPPRRKRLQGRHTLWLACRHGLRRLCPPAPPPVPAYAAPANTPLFFRPFLPRAQI